jgi:hypothetical protein
MKKTLLILLFLVNLSISAQVVISFEASEGYVLDEINTQGPTGNEWELFNSTATNTMSSELAYVEDFWSLTGDNSLRFDSDGGNWGYYAGVYSPVFALGDEFRVTHSFYPDADDASDYVFQIFGFDGADTFVVAALRFDYFGNVQFSDGTTLNDVGTYTAGQWYQIEVERTLTAIILRVDGTQLVSYPVFDTGSIVASYLGFRFDNYGSGFNIDDITVEVPASSSSFDKNSISVYPNPATSVVNLSSKDGLTFENVTIVDVNGRTVKTVAVNQTQSQINVSDLNSGVYFMNIETNEGKTVKKFIKN